MSSEFFSPPIVSSGGGSVPVASPTQTGTITFGTQSIAGKKTVVATADNFIVLDAANPIGLNNGPSGSMSIFAGVNGGHAVNMTNTDPGAGATAFIGVGNDLANGKIAMGVTSSGYTGQFGPDASVYVSDSVGGNFFQNDQPGAPFIWNGGQGRDLLMRLDGQVGGITGDLTLSGGSTTEKLVLNPQRLAWLNQTRTVNSTIQSTVQNLSNGSNAYNQYNILNDVGGGLLFGIPSSTASFGHVQTDQAFLIGSGANGVVLWAQASSGIVALATAGGQNLVLKANGNINMTLQTFANDTLAGAAGLVTGDLYIMSGTQAVTSKV